MTAEESRVDVCPACEEPGKCDPRIKIGGRSVYRCPNDHAWQDMAEEPSTKGYAPLTAAAANPLPEGQR
jgi:hypothetical protein